MAAGLRILDLQRISRTGKSLKPPDVGLGRYFRRGQEKSSPTVGFQVG